MQITLTALVYSPPCQELGENDDAYPMSVLVNRQMNALF